MFTLALVARSPLSVTRPKVKEVLDRYLRLGADVTAIVNYMAMSAYQCERIPTNAGIALLASGVAPQGRGITPLEDLLAASLRAATCAKQPLPHEVIPMAADRKPAQPARLLYWADRAREVDEPDGLWLVEEDGGPVPFLTGCESFPAQLGPQCSHS